MDEIDNRFLDASILSTNKQNSYIEFKTLLQNMYKCYQLMIDNKIPVPFNDENKIRDILLENYINITQIRHSFCNIKGFRISKEVGVNDGRVDLQIFTLNDIENYKAFYIIECKRLDGGSTLNKAYIKDGVKRFTTNYKSNNNHTFYYPSPYGVNGMIGFIVKPINIHTNVQKILPEISSIEKNVLYSSNHENVKLFHLMLDFSAFAIK